MPKLSKWQTRLPAMLSLINVIALESSPACCLKPVMNVMDRLPDCAGESSMILRHPRALSYL